MDVKLIIKFAFFIQELHQEMISLHTQQYGHRDWETFSVYRGQVIPKKVFDQLPTTEDGLVSFNNFLSASFNESLAMIYADAAPAVNVFADVRKPSDLDEEEEVLFSMHSIFRLGTNEKTRR